MDTINDTADKIEGSIQNNNSTATPTTPTTTGNNNMHRYSSSQHSTSQLSFQSAVSQTSHTSSHNTADHTRSRNNSDLSYVSGTSDAGVPFFADMTLDLNMAQMETTPRSDKQFANMLTKNNSKDLMQVIPPMPVHSDSKDDEDDINVNKPSSSVVSEKVSDHYISPTSSGDADDQFVEESLHDDDEDDDTNIAAPSSIFRQESNEQEQSFTRIGTDNNNSTHSSFSQRPTRTPRRPRDVKWTAAAILIIPMGLFIPHIYYPNGYIDRHNNSCLDCTPTHPSWSHMTFASSTHSTILFSSLAATVASFMILRLLYSHPGGGEGDDARHVNVTRTLLLSSNLCIWLNPLLVFSIWIWLPHVRWAIILPLGLMARDAFRVKNTGSALPRNNGGNGMSMQQQQHQSRGITSSGTDRKTFFRALAVASLDILSRSLRRKSFVRAASIVLLVQFVCVSLWWGALNVVLSVEIFQEDSIITKFMHFFWLLLTLIAGKWATGTVARLLGFVASGGVASWFGKQTVIIERMERAEEEEEEQRRENEQQSSPSTRCRLDSDQGDATTADSSTGDSMTSDDPASNYSAARANRYAMPEAYRTADASAYSSALDFDEGLDDDYDEEDDDEYGMGAGRSNSFTRSSSIGYSDHHSSVSNQPSSTVKSFLTAGCTVSFGSVAQCGLLGGLAQFLWSFVRNIEAMGFFIQRRFNNNSRGRRNGFRGMEISVNGSGGNQRQWRQMLALYWRRLDVVIRKFVRSHSDLALSHVAAYFKSYQRAATDVAVLIETSGMWVFI